MRPESSSSSSACRSRTGGEAIERTRTRVNARSPTDHPYEEDQHVVPSNCLDPADALGAALSAAFAARSKSIIDAIRGSGQLSDTDANAALTAAALMGMNTVWYPYVEMADDADLRTQRAELRMNTYATHGGVDKRRFELFALAASIVGKCHFCVASHYQTLNEIGMSAVQLRDVGRIAAAVNAAAQVLVAEDP